VSDRGIFLIDQFIDKEGITEIIHRIAAGEEHAKGALGELAAADLLLHNELTPYPLELVRFGETFHDIKGDLVAEFDGVARQADNRLAFIEAKFNNNVKPGDVEIIQKWLIEKKGQIGTKLAQLRKIIRSQGTLTTNGNIKDPENVDDLIVTVRDISNNEQEYLFIQHE